MEHKMNMVIAGTAKDAHEKFPIRYDVAESGKSFFIGCRVEAEIPIGNGKTITKRMDIRAFGDLADQLAHVQSDDLIEVEGTYDQQQNQNDKKWYPILTVTKVISA